MTDPLLPLGTQQWLDRLELSLRPLPRQEVDAILTEARAHFLDRLGQRQPAGQLLDGFGEAADYARSFVDAYFLERAHSRRSILGMIQAVARIARRSLTGAVGLALAILFGSLGVGAALCLPLKLIYPDRVGLWLDLPLNAHHRYVHTGAEGPAMNIGHDHIVVGFATTPPAFPEVLGGWVYPIFIAIAILCLLAMRALLARTVRSAILEFRRGRS